MRKVDIEPRILKLKTEIYEGRYDGASEEWLNGAHHSLNLVLNILKNTVHEPVIASLTTLSVTSCGDLCCHETCYLDYRDCIVSC